MLTGKIKSKSKITEEELMTFVEVVEEEGEIGKEEKELIHNIFEFDDTNASEITTPRADMFVIEAGEVPPHVAQVLMVDLDISLKDSATTEIYTEHRDTPLLKSQVVP